MKIPTCILVTLVVFSVSDAAQAELRLANIFNDHMVLQQEKPLTIWGWAEPGADVAVMLTESEQQALTVGGAEALQREEPSEQTHQEDPKPITGKFSFAARLTTRLTQGANG